MSRTKDLELARELSKAGEADRAYVIADRYLKDNPNDLPFLTIMTYIMMMSEKHTIAYQLAKRCTEIAPKEPSGWVNFGMACQDLWQSKEASRAYKQGMRVCKDKEQEVMLAVNLTALHIDLGRFSEAEIWAEKTLDLDPDNQKGKANLGFAQLAQRKWKEGWKNYHECLGHDWRPRMNYIGEPEWDGKKTGKVVLYAEQGLGDVISFASMVPDAQKKAKIVLDVNKGLENLLQRSFPEAKVYGTRMEKEIHWEKEDMNPDASISMGQIGEFFRTKDEDFPGTAFLKPCPDRSYMWKEL